jgi:hypothetical protein
MDWAAIRAEGLSGFAMTAIPPTIQLPALPHAVTLFMQRSTNEAVPSEELAKILETDASLTIELLRYVNSSFLGLRQKAKTVQQALSLLGRRRSRMLVFATGTEAALRSRKSKLINQSAFWNACLQKALFAREVAKLLGTDIEVAFAGGLLQDFCSPCSPTTCSKVISTSCNPVRITRQRCASSSKSNSAGTTRWPAVAWPIAGTCPTSWSAASSISTAASEFWPTHNWDARPSLPSPSRPCCPIS